MAKGILSKVDNLPAERILVTLVNTPRTKLDLIEFADAKERYFLLRKIRFMAADNIKGYEIKLFEEEARQVAENVLSELNKGTHLPSGQGEGRNESTSTAIFGRDHSQRADR